MPKSLFELRPGVGLVHTTDEAVEGDETDGGKGPAREEPKREERGPDAEPGCLTAPPCTVERSGSQGRPYPIHRPAAPCRYRSARTRVPTAEAAGKRRSRWDHGGGLPTEPGEQSPGPLRANPTP